MLLLGGFGNDRVCLLLLTKGSRRATEIAAVLLPVNGRKTVGQNAAKD